MPNLAQGFSTLITIIFQAFGMGFCAAAQLESNRCAKFGTLWPIRFRPNKYLATDEVSRSYQHLV